MNLLMRCVSTLNDFAQNEREELFLRLEGFFNNSDTKMTRDRYFEMCEQLGKEPIESEIPVDWDDFPEIVQNAINIYNALGDRLAAEIGYMGKSFELLPLLIDVYGIEDTALLIEILNWLDARAIKKSSEALKKEYAKIRNKSKG